MAICRFRRFASLVRPADWLKAVPGVALWHAPEDFKPVNCSCRVDRHQRRARTRHAVPTAVHVDSTDIALLLPQSRQSQSMRPPQRRKFQLCPEALFMSPGPVKHDRSGAQRGQIWMEHLEF